MEKAKTAEMGKLHSGGNADPYNCGNEMVENHSRSKATLRNLLSCRTSPRKALQRLELHRNTWGIVSIIRAETILEDSASYRGDCSNPYTGGITVIMLPGEKILLIQKQK